MSVKWKEFEDAVFEECQRAFHFRDAEVLRDVHLLGKDSGVKRQIDVLVRQKKGDEETVILMECKHYASKINVKIVDAFIGCLEDVGADKGVIVSENGFTKAAIDRAHKGKNDIEVDIVSLGELRQFQAEGSIVCGGRNALAVSAPFGWIIDGTRRGFAPVVLYRRGIAFEDVTEKEKEWMYLQFWDKRTYLDTMENLIAAQNDALMMHDDHAELKLFCVEGLTVREYYSSTYPTPEITVFKEFEQFIVFGVLYCPECYIARDTKKVVSMLQEAVPMEVRHK